MALSPEQAKAVVGMVAATRDKEIDCDECLLDMAEFAQTQLTGKRIPDALQAVREHLDFCPECREEYEVLLMAVQALNGQA